MSSDDQEDRERGSRGRRGRGGPRGHGGPGSRGRGRRGRRARRGDIRLATLLLLDEEPRNGYNLMQEIEERSGGVWRPSPGSVYPALAQLEDEGLIQPTEHEGSKAFTLTDEGTAHVEANREQMGTPWKTVGDGASSELAELREASKSLAVAAMQVAQTGDAEQLTRAREIVEEARKSLYRLLAGDDPDAGSEKTDD
ncbi:MAG: helix-turn-helix transcriptional regulator [Thermoleophilia bacterium]|nr:helix-turn-helix transcriptional regulator [Thermoleophilia bacterium]